MLQYNKWFEPRIISGLFIVIIWVRVALKRTAVGDQQVLLHGH